MIKNERQYRISKSFSEKFTQELSDLSNQNTDKIDPILLETGKEALKTQIYELNKEIEEYENLKNNPQPLIHLYSIEELPKTLIKARISLGLSQKELAGLVGVKEQQIQRWESTEYNTTSLASIRDVLKALNIRVTESVQLPKNTISISTMFKNIEKAGLDRNFVINKIFPPLVASYFENKNDDNIPAIIGLQAAIFIGKILKLKPENLIDNHMMQPSLNTIPNVRYKVPKGRNAVRVGAYTMYAHSIASIVAQATKDLPNKIIPNDPYTIYNSIKSKYGSINLEALMRYVWELGVPVITLNDPGTFHAVCFRIHNKNIIILKQNTLSTAKWMFDLLHEVWHALKDGEQIVHTDTDMRNTRNSEEKIANLFSAAALLGKNPQILAELCKNHAQNNIARMKLAIEKVAEMENVRADVLANYLAFRYQMEGNNSLWGIAENMQEKMNLTTRTTARNLLFEYSNLDLVSATDLDLLQQAIIPGERT
jgi:transcriptional regulator with XRE-family HTH domain/Zn-dependent peptidase ImmA (M78 family)